MLDIVINLDKAFTILITELDNTLIILLICFTILTVAVELIVNACCFTLVAKRLIVAVTETVNAFAKFCIDDPAKGAPEFGYLPNII